jgi:hypothetical protein
MREIDKSVGVLQSENTPSCGLAYPQFCDAVNRAMRRAPFTRDVIAERMNEALNMGAYTAFTLYVDPAKLNKWFAPSQPNNMPVHYLPALIWAIQDIEAVNELLKPLLFSAVDQHDKMLQRHGELQMEIQQREELQREIANTLLATSSQVSEIDDAK